MRTIKHRVVAAAGDDDRSRSGSEPPHRGGLVEALVYEVTNGRWRSCHRTDRRPYDTIRRGDRVRDAVVGGLTRQTRRPSARLVQAVLEPSRTDRWRRIPDVPVCVQRTVHGTGRNSSSAATARGSFRDRRTTWRGTLEAIPVSPTGPNSSRSEAAWSRGTANTATAACGLDPGTRAATALPELWPAGIVRSIAVRCSAGHSSRSSSRSTRRARH